MLRRFGFATALALTVAPSMAWAQNSPNGTQGAGGTAPAGTGAENGAAAGGADSGMLPETPDTTTPGVESPPAVPPPTGTIPAPRPVTDNLETRTAPIVEVHGYLRNRYDLFYNNSLGWEGFNNGTENLYTSAQYNGAGLPWYRNPDYAAQWCFPDTGTGALTPRPGSCSNPLQTSANMRMRLEPELHPTEFIALHAQIDIFDNLILGSTPQGYYTGTPDNRQSWAPITFMSNTQVSPVAGQNSYVNSIAVKRAWAEVNNQTLGQIRFGRMPEHWGLGMVYNAGNGYDSDYQTDVDRIMYAARLRPFGIFFAASWDFASTGPSSANLNYDEQGQPYDLSTWDDVHQWTVALGRRLEDDQIRAALSRGDLVLNGGLHFAYRQQYLSNENSLGCVSNPAEGYGIGNTCGLNSIRRDAQAFIPDLWVQLLGPGFRIEAEAVYIRGSVSSISNTTSDFGRYTISQFGATFEAEGRLLNNRLMIEFRSGYASGDPDTEGLNYFGGLQPQNRNDKTLSLFRFHPDYRIDLIFWRSIMKQVAGAYYFRPSLGYNFIDDPNGDLFFGRVDVIWSRASEFVSTRGNHADLGVEIDATLQYQTNHYRFDGINRAMAPGFYAMLQGGVFFPLGGLQPTDRERDTNGQFANFHSQTALALHGYLGVVF